MLFGWWDSLPRNVWSLLRLLSSLPLLVAAIRIVRSRNYQLATDAESLQRLRIPERSLPVALLFTCCLGAGLGAFLELGNWLILAAAPVIVVALGLAHRLFDGASKK
jgi:hypothetical protein